MSDVYFSHPGGNNPNVAQTAANKAGAYGGSEVGAIVGGAVGPPIIGGIVGNLVGEKLGEKAMQNSGISGKASNSFTFWCSPAIGYKQSFAHFVVPDIQMLCFSCKFGPG